jgi:hypothetical protein
MGVPPIPTCRGSREITPVPGHAKPLSSPQSDSTRPDPCSSAAPLACAVLVWHDHDIRSTSFRLCTIAHPAQEFLPIRHVLQPCAVGLSAKWPSLWSDAASSELVPFDSHGDHDAIGTDDHTRHDQLQPCSPVEQDRPIDGCLSLCPVSRGRSVVKLSPSYLGQ